MISPAAPILIVGAGISGLSAALMLARSGKRVRIIERSVRPGGLAASELFRGIPCDIGSHRLHRGALDGPIFREIHARHPFLTRSRRGVLLFGGLRVAYPPSAMAMLSALGPSTSLSLGFGFLGPSRRGRAFVQWEQHRVPSNEADDVGFEKFVIDRVGEPAYRVFYEPYARKVWGIDPALLSQTVAKKRFSASKPWALLQSTLGRVLAKLEGSSKSHEALDQFVYPAGGISSIIGYLERELSTWGISIECGVPFDVTKAREGPALFAGDLKDLVPTKLEHRGIYLVYLALPMARAGEHETYYSPDPRYWFGRVSELQHYSPELSHPNETILCVEIPEGAWGQGLDFAGGPLFQTLLVQLQDAGIVPRGMVPIERRQLFVPQVYPLYRRGFRVEWRETMRRVVELGGIFPFGRQALFLHCNLDHCVDIAVSMVDHILAGGNARSWVDVAEAYLDLRVRD
jgi:NAD(P)-binding Rossmann-like domain